MATVSAGTLVLLVIASLSVCSQSWSIGCTKLIGKPEGRPGEFLVKINHALAVQKIVNMMMELGTSECQGRLWRSSNASDALFTLVTCSDLMFQEEDHGFSAKMSNAAVMWVCDNDAVDYIEPKYNLPTDDASGVAPTFGSILTPDTDDDDEPEGSGTTTVVPSTIPPSSNKCTKINEYRDGDSHQFIVVMNRDTSPTYMRLFVQNVKYQSKKLDSKMIIKSIQPLVYLQQIIAEMNMNAMEYVCKNPRVKYIEYNAPITIPFITPGASATTITTATPTTAAPTVISTPSTEQCNKLRGGKIRSNRLNLCRIYMTTSSTKSDCRKFIRMMEAMDNSVKSDVRFEVKQVGHDRQRPMIIAKLNIEAIDKVCKSKNTQMIIRI